MQFATWTASIICLQLWLVNLPIEAALCTSVKPAETDQFLPRAGSWCNRLRPDHQEGTNLYKASHLDGCP